MSKKHPKDRKPKLPRAPLPRQTGGAHRAGKGRGAYNRQQENLAVRRGEFD